MFQRDIPHIIERNIFVDADIIRFTTAHLPDEDDISAIRLVLNQLPADRRTPAAETDTDEQTQITPAVESKVDEVIAYLKENYRFEIAREGLASMVDLNPDYLGKMFKTRTGMRISDYTSWLRIQESMELLHDRSRSIIDIAFAVGFESLRTFNRVFAAHTGMTPTTYREKNYN